MIIEYEDSLLSVILEKHKRTPIAYVNLELEREDGVNEWQEVYNEAKQNENGTFETKKNWFSYSGIVFYAIGEGVMEW